MPGCKSPSSSVVDEFQKQRERMLTLFPHGSVSFVYSPNLNHKYNYMKTWETSAAEHLEQKQSSKRERDCGVFYERNLIRQRTDGPFHFSLGTPHHVT